MVELAGGSEQTAVTDQQVEELLKDWVVDSEDLIAAMLAVQEKYNWLPPEALDYISRRLNVRKPRIYHIATFYRVFSLVPRGKHILQLCMGTACHVRGAELIAGAMSRQHGLQFGKTTDDGLFTLERVNCLGACAIGPILVVDGEYKGNMTTNRTNAVVKRLKREAAKEEGANA